VKSGGPGWGLGWGIGAGVEAGPKADWVGVVLVLVNADWGCVAKAERGWAAENGLATCENAPVDALPPGPNTEPPVVDGAPGPNTDPPVGLVAACVPVDALPPGPKTDPVGFGFGFENTDPPKADPVDDCCCGVVPNAEGCPNADVVVAVVGAGAPKTDGVGAPPNEDGWPNTDAVEGAGRGADPNADGWPANAENPPPPPDGAFALAPPLPLPPPNAEAPVPANAPNPPPLPKAPEAGFIIPESG
jgi:hypothetical protein